MKLIKTTFKCILTWFAVLGVFVLLSAGYLSLRFKDAVKMAKPDYKYVIVPDDQKNVNRYMIEKEKHSLAIFIASLVISQTAVVLTNVQKKAVNL